MITISVANLKKFFQKASHIHSKGVLPICDYILIEVISPTLVKITKSSVDRWVVVIVDAVVSKGQGSIAVYGKTLLEVVKFATAADITIEEAGKKLVIHSGIDRDTCAAGDVQHFPVAKSNEGADKFPMPDDLLEGLAIAKLHTAEFGDGTNQMSYVHVNSNKKVTILAALNQFTAFLKKLDESFPVTIFEPSHISAIAGNQFVTYSQTDRYHFFEIENVTYGFIKPEISVYNSLDLWGKFEENALFHAKRSDVVSFCEKAVSIGTSSSLPATVKISDCPEGIELDYNDGVDNQGVNRKIKVTGKSEIFPTTDILPKSIVTALSQLTVDEISVTKLPGRLLITSEEDNTSKTLIGELAPPQKQ